jgi:16S rRNA (cytosine1402-N4)-methyltransferase
MSTYHTAVLLHESIDALNIKPDGIYVDVTYGGGGHSSELLKRLGPKGRLIAFDQDLDAKANLIADERITFVQANFRHLARFLKLHKISKVDGILADLGVSSHQFDTGERGFSYRFDGPLDMRMNTEADIDATKIVNTYSEQELQQVFSEYGEVSNSKTLAIALVQARSRQDINTIQSFLAVVEPNIRGSKHSYLAQVFQALRIAVNDEMNVLKEFLEQSAQVLNVGGRLAVISFHSLEDKLVKQYIKRGAFGEDHVKDKFGNITLPFKVISKKAIEATKEELAQNKRSHSAKLRVAEKI